MTSDIQAELNADLLFSSEPPATLFHYTDQHGLLGIVEEKCLWATDIRFVNDELEYQYTVALVRDLLAERSTRAMLADIPKLEAIWQEALGVVEMVRHYVVSFSEVCDDLSQWRAYSAGGGYSLGLKGGALRDHAIEQDFPTAIVRCEYDLNSQSARIRGALEKMAVHFRENHTELGDTDVDAAYGSLFAGHLVNLATALKHPSFAAEQEWRLVLRPRPTEISSPDTAFRPGRRNIVPYLRLALPDDAFSQVWIGPTPHHETAVSAVVTLLKSNGIEGAPVFQSESPYRDW